VNLDVLTSPADEELMEADFEHFEKEASSKSELEPPLLLALPDE
jgi:hypothetical protein